MRCHDSGNRPTSKRGVRRPAAIQPSSEAHARVSESIVQWYKVRGTFLHPPIATRDYTHMDIPERPQIGQPSLPTIVPASRRAPRRTVSPLRSDRLMQKRRRGTISRVRPTNHRNCAAEAQLHHRRPYRDNSTRHHSRKETTWTSCGLAVILIMPLPASYSACPGPTFAAGHEPSA